MGTISSFFVLGAGMLQQIILIAACIGVSADIEALVQLRRNISGVRYDEVLVVYYGNKVISCCADAHDLPLPIYNSFSQSLAKYT